MKFFSRVIVGSVFLALLACSTTHNNSNAPDLKSFESPKTYGNNAMTNAHKM